MSYVWRLLMWLAASALIVTATLLGGGRRGLPFALCGAVLLFWPVWARMTGRDSVLDTPVPRRVGWLASGLALILFLGSLFLFAQPELIKQAPDLGWALMLSAFGVSWTKLEKRQEH